LVAAKHGQREQIEQEKSRHVMTLMKL